MAEKYVLPIQGLTSDGLAVSIDEIPLGFLTQLAGWDRFGEAAGLVLAGQGLALPSDYRKPVRSGQSTVWRIAPDRVLVRSDNRLDFENTDDLVALDLSDARVCLTVGGPGAAGLLSRMMALDFAETAFPIGHFAQTSLHHVGVLVERLEADRFTLFIPTTWATSLIGLLADHLAKAA